MPKRKDDRKRAELAGKAVLNYAKADPRFAAALRGILDGAISAKRDRELLGLPVDKPLENRLRSRDAQLAILAAFGPESLLGQ
jgi:hypothetical protein